MCIIRIHAFISIRPFAIKDDKGDGDYFGDIKLGTCQTAGMDALEPLIQPHYKLQL